MLKKLKARRQYQKAVDALGEDEVLCGTYDSDGNPIYFSVPKWATDEEVRLLAFEARHGRRMSKLEMTLLEFAKGTNRA